MAAALFDDEQRLAELDRLAVLDQDLADRAGMAGFDLVHDLHRLDDAHRLVFLDGAAHSLLKMLLKFSKAMPNETL